MADEAPLLPELARSLRVLGAPNDVAAEAAHAAIFGPLLAARARASRGDAGDALAALRGERLSARIVAQVHAAAAAGSGDAARGRARDAAALELIQPLLASLAELDRVATEIPARAAASSAPWERWVAQLRLVFSAADSACGALGQLLAEGGEDAPPPRRWFGRSGGGEK